MKKNQWSTQRKLAALLILVSLVTNVCFADVTKSSWDWLIANEIENYIYLLRSSDIPPPVQEKFKEKFNRFAFEYWVACQTDRSAHSTKCHNYIREMLHRDAKNEKYLNDPAMLLPFFKDGKLIASLGIVPTRGIDYERITLGEYQAKVKEFKSAFQDFTEIFPLDPKPGNPLRSPMEIPSPVLQNALTELFAAGKWNG
jgi:hypothetical protein